MSDPRCDHQIHLTNARGERHGSWSEIDRRVQCRYCGKFYGYMKETPVERDKKHDPTEDSLFE